MYVVKVATAVRLLSSLDRDLVLSKESSSFHPVSTRQNDCVVEPSAHRASVLVAHVIVRTGTLVE